MCGRVGAVLAAAIWGLSAPGAAATLAHVGLHLDLQSGGAGVAAHRVDRILTPQGSDANARVYRWNERAAGCCDTRGELMVQRGDRVGLAIRLHNPSAHSATVHLVLSLALPPALRAPTEFSGTLFGRVSVPRSGAARGPGLASLGGAPVFALLLNGTEVASVPLPLPVAEGAVLTPQAYAGRYGPSADDGVGRNLAILVRLRLGPGATVSFHTRTQLATAPFPVGVLALGIVLLALLVLVRWRRQIRVAIRRPATHRAP